MRFENDCVRKYASIEGVAFSICRQNFQMTAMTWFLINLSWVIVVTNYRIELQARIFCHRDSEPVTPPVDVVGSIASGVCSSLPADARRTTTPPNTAADAGNVDDSQEAGLSSVTEDCQSSDAEIRNAARDGSSKLSAGFRTNHSRTAVAPARNCNR